jgi:hypothetical protein
LIPLAAVVVAVTAACGGSARAPDPVGSEIAAAVRLRGLAERTPIRVDHVDRRQIGAVLARALTGDPGLSPDWDRALHLLGVLEPGQRLAATVRASLDAGVAGLYDPSTRRLYVVDGAGGGAGPSVIVHEATHALQDQWFHLGAGAFAQTTDADAALAAHALVEGDATDVQSRFLTGQGLLAALSEGLAALGALPGAPQLPPFLAREQDFPYVAGQAFVEALRAGGGEAAVDRAFRHPPRTTAAVLDPARFVAGDPAAAAVAVPAPPAGYRRAIDTTFGAEDLVALTGDSSLASVWRGGRIVLDRGPRDELTLVLTTSAPRLVAAGLRRALPASAAIRTSHSQVTVSIR